MLRVTEMSAMDVAMSLNGSYTSSTRRFVVNKFMGLVVIGLVFAQGAFAVCFDFTGKQPREVGPVRLAARPTQVCVHTVKTFGGRKYYSVRFRDAEGDLAQLASQTELLGRCPGFCRTYTLTSGNSNGANVNPDSTVVQFQVETNEGKVTISHPSTRAMSYPVARQ